MVLLNLVLLFFIQRNRIYLYHLATINEMFGKHGPIIFEVYEKFKTISFFRFPNEIFHILIKAIFSSTKEVIYLFLK